MIYYVLKGNKIAAPINCQLISSHLNRDEAIKSMTEYVKSNDLKNWECYIHECDFEIGDLLFDSRTYMIKICLGVTVEGLVYTGHEFDDEKRQTCRLPQSAISHVVCEKFRDLTIDGRGAVSEMIFALAKEYRKKENLWKLAPDPILKSCYDYCVTMGYKFPEVE